MTFDEVLAQVQALLQREGRVSYRGLKRRFALDDEYLEDLKEELIGAKRLATDEDGRFLVWTGGTTVPSNPFPVLSPSTAPPSSQPLGARPQTLDSQRDAGERRQLTVEFIDLVGSTTLSQQLDPEDYHARVVAYQTACQQVIARYEGHIAQYLGDGVLVYFGYPIAHEDDAVRAVHSGLEIVAAVRQLAYTPPLQVHIGIHTGLVVVGEIGNSGKRETLALGETPNLAARLQALAEPNTVVISAATQRLIGELFTCRSLGLHEPKGLSVPLEVYQVLAEGELQSRFEVAVRAGLTPLVGREQEVGLLLDLWERAKAGEGQVALLSGEPGIGKSRLLQVLSERLVRETYARVECRCSPFYQNTALYPVIDHLQRLLRFTKDDAPQEKWNKLESTLQQYGFLLPEVVPLFASLLSLPLPGHYPPLSLSPQKQKQKTLEALVLWLLKEAERQPLRLDLEDLHWADPSTLEFLGLLIDQVPRTRLLVLLTCRPEFRPPWPAWAHLTQLMLRRLAPKQAEVMVQKMTGGKGLPAEVLQQIVAKTDGVPLFVEELTKSIMESVGALREAPLQLAIPATLHDALMARLDRLTTVKEVAQIGATLGREFTYEVLQAVSLVDEASLRPALAKLVEGEVLYQRGLPPQARYLFKHALIQDAAYQSLLKSKRQQYHQQIAQVLAETFPETKETQPELLAHHFTEAGLIAQAFPYWQRAGDRAVQRSANVEAISYLTQGLELLKTLPDTPERAQHELTLQITLGTAFIATEGYSASEVGIAYTRARELCQQTGETAQLFPVLGGLWQFHIVRAQYQITRELGELILSLAQNERDPAFLLVEAHDALGQTFCFLGELSQAQAHLEQGILLYDPQHHRVLTFLCGGEDPGIACRVFAAWTLCLQGYPDQALTKSHAALSLAQEVAHPFSLAVAFTFTAVVHMFRGERPVVQERAEAGMTLSSEQRFAGFLAWGTILQGWALAMQRQGREGIAQICQGLAAYQATAGELFRPYFLALLAEAYGKVGQNEEGLTTLAEALAQVEKTGERYYEAELYRLKGALTLQSQASLGQVSSKSWTSPGQVSDESKTSQEKSENPSFQPLTPSTPAEAEAEACFLKAIEIARRQQAKSLELRAVMSLSRLWQQQGKKGEAHKMLTEIYGWFTEGFDTRDLQEAKALLEELT